MVVHRPKSGVLIGRAMSGDHISKLMGRGKNENPVRFEEFVMQEEGGEANGAQGCGSAPKLEVRCSIVQ